MMLLLVDHTRYDKEPNHSNRQECVREEPNSTSITITQQMLVLISRIPEIDMAFSLAKFMILSPT